MKLSLCMIVKNEEEVLERALKSAQPVADEIIIVDTGSTDKTEEIAKKFTDKVFNFAWVDDFSLARNYSFSKATCDYIIWLDADDEISEENQQKLINLKKSMDGSVDVYFLKYAFPTIDNSNSLEYFRERIIKNNNTMKWADPVHEFIEINGKIEYVDIAIHHKKIKPAATNRNLNIYEKYILKGSELTPRQKFYYARELYYNGKMFDAVKILENFLVDGLGWLENNIEASIVLAKCYVAIGKHVQALKTLFASFIYDYPRAEVLCEIGTIFMLIKNYKNAIPWLKLAAKCKPNVRRGGFVLPQCYDIVPYLQLCVCYFNLNEISLAIKYNEKAKKVDANNDSVKVNTLFFDELSKKKSKEKKIK